MRNSISFLLGVFLIVSACKKETSQTDNLFKFKDYISYASQGNTSTAAPIRIELAKPLMQYEPTQELPADLISISPKTKGKLSVENGRTLLFKPENRLDTDTEYTISVKLDKLYDDVKKGFETYTFRFKTFKPNFKVNLGNLQSYSKKWQYAQANLETSDIISLEKAKKLITATQGDKALSIKWPSAQEDGQFYNFTIDSISRKLEDSEILIRWDGAAIDSKNKGADTLAIPGQNNFSVIDVSTTVAPQASMAINFSDPLMENQDFKGLVTIDSVQTLRFEVDGNILNVYPSSRVIGDVQVNLFEGIKNTEGFSLKEPFSELVSFEALKPAVRLLSSGVILPNAASTPLYFEAVNLKAVDVRVIKVFENNMLQFLQSYNLNQTNIYDIRPVGRRVAKKTINLSENGMGGKGQWKAHAIDLSKFFKSDPGALYRIEFSFKQNYALYRCPGASASSGKGELPFAPNASAAAEDSEDALEEQYWDNEVYSYQDYYYDWEQRDNPCSPAYYTDDRMVAMNVLGSNLGMIVKKGNNNTYKFATTDLITAKPMGGVEVKLYNYQQQLITSTTTDGDGFTGVDSDRTAAFAIAKHGDNYAYAKLEDGNALSLSNFDISGKELQKGLKGFIYTERGVYRPGDSIHLTFVLNDLANPLPKNHPIKLDVTDARGKLVLTKVQSSDFSPLGGDAAGRGGFGGWGAFTIPTNPEDPTGNWNATISIGGAQFTKNLRVATVKPNRLKIKLDFDRKILQADEAVSGSLSATWLHGAPARNLEAEMTVTLRESPSAFEKFPNYVFTDPVRSFDEVEIPILKTTLSPEGNINFSKQLELGKNAPGMLQATFLTKVFEGGGDFSMDVFSKQLAPYPYFVGLRSPKAREYGSYYTDEITNFDLLSIDAQGKPAPNRQLQVKVFRIEWRWWFNRGEDNLSRYENSTVHTAYKSFEITTNSAGKANFDINVPEKQGGRYLIRVIDPESGHATGRTAYFYQNWSNAPAGSAESAKMLVFTADKENYSVGDEAKITFPSGSGGRALLSIENGTQVLSTQWIETKKGETSATVKLTKEMAPNVYVNISLLQPHAQTKNDHPIRLYGVIPIMVEDPNTILKPQLNMPEVLKPDQSFKIKVSEANGKPMTYTVAMVDEGLLDLTRFATPDIHEAFYSREALGVKTFDIFDDVIGAFSGSVDNIYAIGGGDMAAGAKNRKADRFKPVVKFLGPFQLKAGEKATHTIKMPNYIGSVRTMVVAGDNSKGAYGSTDKTTPVRKPLMVLASLPRKLSPGETVTLPVTIFAMEKKVKNVTVIVKTGKGLKAIGSASKNISFNEVGEQIVNFEFKVQPDISVQNINVIAAGGGEQASTQIAINVENPNPVSQTAKTYTLEKGTSEDISFETFGIAGSNGASVEFSTLPPMDFNKRMEYLIRYPYGCLEQTVSSAFPQLYLADVFDITFEKKKEIEENVKATLDRLANFQLPDGGLSYWPGERDADDWSTSYAGHFALEAKQKGYALPISFLSNWLNYQQNAARQWRNATTYYNSSLTQAYRLYTLALAGQPELAAMNRLREGSAMSNDAKWRLAAAYALAGKKDVAEQIAQTANINFEPERYDRYTYGSPFRNQAMALETMVALEDPKQRELATSLAKDLSSDRWYSTQETAFALLSLAKMVGKNGGKAMELTYTINGKTQNIKTERAIAQRDLGIKDGNNSLTINNKKDNLVYVTVSQTGKLPLGEELAERQNLTLQAQYLDGNEKPVDVSSLRQGTGITAKIMVTNTSGNDIDNVALSRIFPSGWEVVNTSFIDLGGGATGDARYTDIRDDRVNFFFDLKAGQTKTFSVSLNASYLGTYYLPGSQVEAMYDNTYFARNRGMWVEVVK